MTLNVWGRNEWRRRRCAVVEWINEIRPDLVALQEVVHTIGRRQAAWLAERTGMTAVFGPARTTFGGEFGNAVLSRVPVLTSQCHPLTDASSGNEPRAMLTVDAVAFGRRVSFSSTHLSWQFDEGWIREQQVREVAAIIAAHPSDFPPIVGGDFNAEPESDEIRFLTERYVDAFGEANPGVAGHTWSNANPFAAKENEHDRRIDYIFVGGATPAGGGRVLSAEVVCDEPRAGAWPTDHFGVAATLSLRRARSAPER
jgi:endonuclease/exonuclease/phosphatase family metal-dependent hydrolase